MQCMNCDADASWFYKTASGGTFTLCDTCKEAFELGQANSQAGISIIEDLEAA